jgi:hypothetical protein
MPYVDQDHGGMHELEELFAGFEPEELRTSYIAVPGPGLRAAGSTVPLLGAVGEAPSGLALPVGTSAGPQPIDFAHVYMTLEDYVPFDTPAGSLTPEEAKAQIRRHHDSTTILMHLAFLNGLARQGPAVLEQLALDYERHLDEAAAERFRNVRTQGPEPHRFLARQPILAAMREVLVNDAGPVEEPSLPPIVVAAALSHAVAVTLASDQDRNEDIAGTPEHLFFEMLRLGPLYESDGMWESIDRQVRLWRHYGEQLIRTRLRAAPAQLLSEAAGLELETLLSLGFAVFAVANSWKPGQNTQLPDLTLGLGMAPEELEVFWDLVAATPEDLRRDFEGHTDSPFDFLPIQMRPVLRLPNAVIPLDVGYLWDRVTTGLYWLVHDMEKVRSDRDRLLWTQGFAEAVELMVEDGLRHLAPRDLSGATTFYTEEDFGLAYPEAKRPDAAIDFGHRLLVVEVVSGALSVPTRIEGRRDGFEADVERLIVKKCRQLDSAAQALTRDPHPLTGHTAPAGLRVIPTLVVGGGFPLNPLTMQYIETKLSEEGLLQHPLVSPLSIIDLGDVEALEALGEQGLTPVDVLESWHESALRAVPLRNFLLERWTGQQLRPSRMSTVRQTFDTISDILKIPS